MSKYIRRVSTNQSDSHHCTIVSSSYASGVILEHHTLGWFSIQLKGVYPVRSKKINQNKINLKRILENGTIPSQLQKEIYELLTPCHLPLSQVPATPKRQNVTWVQFHLLVDCQDQQNYVFVMQLVEPYKFMRKLFQAMKQGRISYFYQSSFIN